MPGPSHTWVKPVTEIYRPIWAYSYVTWPEKAGGNFLDITVLGSSTHEVRPIILFSRIGLVKVESIKLKGACGGFRSLTQNCVESGITAEKRAIPFLSQGPIFIKGDPCGSPSTIDVSGIHCAWVILPPVHPVVGLPGPTDCLVSLLSAPRKIARAAVFKRE